MPAVATPSRNLKYVIINNIIIDTGDNDSITVVMTVVMMLVLVVVVFLAVL